jgi:predicted cupin superfamily sugar epimerase
MPGRHNGDMDVDALILALELEPHPEGGHYRQTWADASSTAIYFLLREGEVSMWHRLRGRPEIWHFYAGDPLELSVDTQAPGRAATKTIHMGSDIALGQKPQAVVPADAWQRARSLGRWSLVGCTVAPPFSFDAFELAPATA